MTLREKIINKVKELKAEPLMKEAPKVAGFLEDNFPEALNYVSTEGRIAGLLHVLELLDEGDNNDTDHDDKTDC